MPCIVQCIRDVVELLGCFDLGDNDPRQAVDEPFCYVALEPGGRDGVDPHEDLLLGTENSWNDRLDIRARLIFQVRRSRIFAVDDDAVGPTLRQSLNEVGSDRRSEKERALASHRLWPLCG